MRNSKNPAETAQSHLPKEFKDVEHSQSLVKVKHPKDNEIDTKQTMEDTMQDKLPNVISRDDRVRFLKLGMSGKNIEQLAVAKSGYLLV